jgi:hypothetical protein
MSSRIDNSTSDPGGGSSTAETDEVKIFECEKHEEDIDIDGDENIDRLSPVIKEEEVRSTFCFSYISTCLSCSHHPNQQIFLVILRRYFLLIFFSSI